MPLATNLRDIDRYELKAKLDHAVTRRGFQSQAEKLKAALKEQYEEPNKQKAIDIYLGLALDAHTGGDLKGAVAYYVKILSIDRENTEAKSALAKLADQYQQAIKDSKRAGSKGGGSDDNDKPWDTEDYSGAGRGYSGGWGDIGRSGW